MIVTAALPWYDERPWDLGLAVRSLAGMADRLVALDGAYRRYPGGNAVSPYGQAEAIREAADEVRIDCRIVTTDRLWAGQVEKRSHLLALASVGSDWLLTLDADHVVHTDPLVARAELEQITEDVVEVEYRTPVNPRRSMEDSAAGEWHREQSEAPSWVPHLWRVLPGMRVERFHYWYSAMKGHERVWLWCPDEIQTPLRRVPHRRLEAAYHVEHRCLFRGQQQILANRAFCNDREMVVALTGQEDHRDGIPDPEWEYERLPA